MPLRRRAAISAVLAIVTIFVHLEGAVSDETSFDTCSTTSQIVNSTTEFCGPLQILTDSRGYSKPTGQCRTLCGQSSIPADIVTSTKLTNNNKCKTRCTDLDTCIPVNECIRDCGTIPDNCIYSGTCGSIHCFSKTPYRFTHTGEGSILNEEDKQKVSVHINPSILGLTENQCKNNIITTHCEDKNDILKDGRMSDTNSQCRSLCHTFENKDTEIISIPTKCTYCNSKQAADNEYVKRAPDKVDIDRDLNLKNNNLKNKFHICIPSSKCEENCGIKLKLGCFFSGDCSHIHCLSTIDSKKAITFKRFDDVGTDIQLNEYSNDKSDRSTIDPPIFGDSNSNVFHTVTPQPTKLASSSPSSTMIENGLPANSASVQATVSSSNIVINNSDTNINENIPSSTLNANLGGNVCIAVKHLSNHELVYGKNHKKGFVLCDQFNSCATPYHLVQLHNVPMTMWEYCQSKNIFCNRYIMWVNSPNYQKGLKIHSSSKGLVFTPFAATYGTKMETYLLSFLIKLGF